MSTAPLSQAEDMAISRIAEFDYSLCGPLYNNVDYLRYYFLNKRKYFDSEDKSLEWIELYRTALKYYRTLPRRSQVYSDPDGVITSYLVWCGKNDRNFHKLNI
jgi:hypothetical protein